MKIILLIGVRLHLTIFPVFQQSTKMLVFHMHPHLKLLRDNFTTNNALELVNICTIIYLHNISVKVKKTFDFQVEHLTTRGRVVTWRETLWIGLVMVKGCFGARLLAEEGS